MVNKLKYIICILIILLNLSANAQSDYVLVWQDEFNTDNLNTANWNYDIGNGCPDLCGWGNNELEYYTQEAVRLNNGVLQITAREESTNGFNYSSGKIHSQNKQTFTYGKFEARIKLPKGQGIWPAFWLLYNDPIYGIWPASGEIDIMEALGHEPDLVHGTVHYGGNPKGGSFNLPLEDFSDDFHTFSIEWDSNKVLWFVDSIQYAGITRWGIDQGFNWPFDHPFYIILNVAVGGNWPGSPNSTTVFPQTMEIDWVRVYQKVLPTSIENTAKEAQVSIAPNPVENHKIRITNNSQALSQYSVYNVRGELVLKTQSNKKNLVLHIENLAPGKYFLHSLNANSKKILSFMKTN